jgi:hypothetical protein
MSRTPTPSSDWPVGSRWCLRSRMACGRRQPRPLSVSRRDGASLVASLAGWRAPPAGAAGSFEPSEALAATYFLLEHAVNLSR